MGRRLPQLHVEGRPEIHLPGQRQHASPVDSTVDVTASSSVPTG
jgi:hypothetical protein